MNRMTLKETADKIRRQIAALGRFNMEHAPPSTHLIFCTIIDNLSDALAELDRRVAEGETVK